MDIAEWWPKVDASAQEWLIANNGDVVDPDVLRQIAATGADVTATSPWVGEHQPDGVVLSDAATDWIEAVANGEHPGGPSADRTQV